MGKLDGKVAIVTGGGQGCFNQPSFKTLADAKQGLVIAPIDMGARVLMSTPHKVLAAPYHRNNTGNLAAYQVFLLPQSEAKARVAALGGNYVAICKRSAEVTILSREAPKGLMADLEGERIPVDPAANFPSRVIRSKTSLHLPDWGAIDLPVHERQLRALRGISASLMLPLLRHGDCIGILVLQRNLPGAFSDKVTAA